MKENQRYRSHSNREKRLLTVTVNDAALQDDDEARKENNEGMKQTAVWLCHSQYYLICLSACRARPATSCDSNGA
jgi:hypothetical protein